MKEIEAKNPYGKGHEQQNKRPYVVVYESIKYCLAFPKTTKKKSNKEYPSHKNFKLPDGNEIMIDQLTIILNQNIIENNLSDFQIQLQQLTYAKTDINSLIDYFCKYVILQNKKYKQTFQVQFGDIIEFKHSHPLLVNQEYFIVLSSGVFHQSKMCCIAPYNRENGNIDYSLLHCIDFEKREILKIDNKEYFKKDRVADKIKTLFLGNQNV